MLLFVRNDYELEAKQRSGVMSKGSQALRLPRAKGMDMVTFYSPKDCAKKAKFLILPKHNRTIIEEFLTVLGMREAFEEHGVPVPNKIVMYGPPGTGKTLTAFYMAKRLELPLISIRLDALIHSHLGETGSNIRKVFDYAEAQPCVLFIDEFDAIARTRESGDEVKEMARAVNTLLQALDDFGDRSVFMAATNLEAELDRAIWRRFDTKITYSLPDETARNEYIQLLVGDFETEEKLGEAACERLAGCSFAEVEQIVLKAKRKAIIQNCPLGHAHIELSYNEYQPAVRR